MNFGAFAGGLSDGFGSGVRMGKTLREIIKENKMQETLAAAREEAGAAYDADQQKKATSVEEGPAEAGQPYKTESGATVTPVTTAAKVAGTGLPPLASPTESPDAAGAATAAASQPPPAVATQSLAAPAVGASSDGNAGEAEAGAAMVKPTPQQQAATAPSGQPPVAAGGIQPGKFESGGQKFDTRTQAESAAGVKNDPVARSTYIQKHMAQKAQDYFLSIGDMESAEKYGKYAETLAGKQAIKSWADAKSAPDIDTRAKNFGKYYTDHVNDGVDYSGHKILTKEDGTQVAVVMLKDKATGKTSEMELTDEKMIQLGDAWNPAAVFKNESARAAAVAAQRAKMGEEAYKSRLKLGEEKYKADLKDQGEAKKAEYAKDLERTKGQQNLSEITLRGQIDLQNVGEKAKVELTAKTEALKAAGYTDDEIKPMVPMLLKVGEYKKMTDPAERRAIIGTELMKSDPTFSRATAEEQKARIDKAMSAIMGDAAPGAPAQAGKAGAQSAPDKAPAAPVYVRDKTTGQVFKLEGGQKVPVGPAAKPPAQAAPTAPPQAAPPPAAAGVPPPQATQAPKEPTTLDQIQAKNMAAVQPMVDQLKQAEQVFVTVARSGDQAAMAKYMQQKDALRAQLIAQVTERFGNNAGAVLKQLGVQ